MKISSFSIILIFFCLSLAGLAIMPLLPVKLSPSQTLPEVNVSFNLAGNAARVVEMEATSRLEAMFARIKGVENISSTSGNGWGRIYIRFNKHTDVAAARFEVSTIIRQTWPFLPEGISYPVISMSQSDEKAGLPFLTYTVNAPANPIVIQLYTENNIKPKLSQIPGINKVDVSGAMPMEWRLEYDYKQLETLGITVQDIQSAIAGSLNKEFFGTAMVDSTEWIRLSLLPKEDNTADFDPAGIIVKNIAGKQITLDKLVTVVHREQEARSYYRINGLNSIYLSITSEESANQLDLSKKIKETLQEMEAVFPAGYEIHLSYDATEYIRTELDKVWFRSSLTLLILLVFVLLIYRSIKYLLMISVSLFMNIAIAIIFYYSGGLEIQLYSLAGITISLNLVIDNTIIMSDQIIRRHNKKAFLAILTATVTTIASLVIIFFMEERIRLNLQDFALVIIVNLSLSLFVALFLVPALIEKLRMDVRYNKKGTRFQNTRFRRKYGLFHKFRKPFMRRLSYAMYLKILFRRFYSAFCCFTWRWRVPVCIFIVLAFGLPVFMLPENIESEGKAAEIYNKTLGSTFYKEKIKTHVDTWLGGTLRLFTQKVFEGGYFANREETYIYVTATLPNGATIQQMNNLIQRMESYISQFTEIRQFQTNINNARRANISVWFTKESSRSGFPYLLYSNLITKANELGGGSWSVSGLGDGFSNNVWETAGGYRILMHGFNYDDLWSLAEGFKSKMLENSRIRDVIINSEFSFFKDDYQEFVFDLNLERLAQADIQPIQLFASIQPMFGKEIHAGYLPGEYGMERMVLHSKQSEEYDVWSMENIPGKIGTGKEYKLIELAQLQKIQAPQDIVKENQQYRLCLQYEYIGAAEQGRRVMDNSIEEFQKEMPMGYTIKSESQFYNWGSDNKRQYALLLLIFAIIYVMCSILFNSLKQPFAVIFVIPISFIGIFLTFYLFGLQFDQGGFAAFVLLCGLAVNANIYVLNEYNNIRQRWKLSPLKAYIKAWSAKISPIFLTVISTVLGFIPFMVGEYKEAFWYPLAAGTIGGLAVSLFGTFCFLPLFMGVGRKKYR
ncbi:MAG: efflux RND transporter permease subunit [Bacteroidales bacterium]|jgi:multidrug efflux pump subunit AcrB|nr:efflux RND transporter permease subunit [Bacteroidales bacterium]